MTCGWIPSVRYLGLVVLAVAVCGCAQRTANQHQYVLAASRPGASVAAQSSAILEVRRFTIDAAFADRQLVYRLGASEYESDFYHEFLVTPAVMVTDRVRQWLAHSGVFANVLVPQSRLTPSHVLEGNITALHGDFRDASAPMAVVELRCFLIDETPSAQTVLLSKTYEATLPVESRDAEALVATLDRCIARVLTRLENDLKTVLSGDG